MMSNGNATAATPAAADPADVLDCGSLDVSDFETIQVSMDDIDHDKSLRIASNHPSFRSRSPSGWREWP